MIGSIACFQEKRMKPFVSLLAAGAIIFAAFVCHAENRKVRIQSGPTATAVKGPGNQPLIPIDCIEPVQDVRFDLAVHAMQQIDVHCAYPSAESRPFVPQ
jgi:hypothetical protein